MLVEVLIWKGMYFRVEGFRHRLWQGGKELQGHMTWTLLGRQSQSELVVTLLERFCRRTLIQWTRPDSRVTLTLWLGSTSRDTHGA
jgi:hypothetical protein